jgi:hypothetical protein
MLGTSRLKPMLFADTTFTVLRQMSERTAVKIQLSQNYLGFFLSLVEHHAILADGLKSAVLVDCAMQLSMKKAVEPLLIQRGVAHGGKMRDDNFRSRSSNESAYDQNKYGDAGVNPAASTDLLCPACGQTDLIPEHAHMACPKCRWRDSCCF